MDLALSQWALSLKEEKQQNKIAEAEKLTVKTNKQMSYTSIFKRKPKSFNVKVYADFLGNVLELEVPVEATTKANAKKLAESVVLKRINVFSRAVTIRK